MSRPVKKLEPAAAAAVHDDADDDDDDDGAAAPTFDDALMADLAGFLVPDPFASLSQTQLTQPNYEDDDDAYDKPASGGAGGAAAAAAGKKPVVKRKRRRKGEEDENGNPLDADARAARAKEAADAAENDQEAAAQRAVVAKARQKRKRIESSGNIRTARTNPSSACSVFLIILLSLCCLPLLRFQNSSFAPCCRHGFNPWQSSSALRFGA